MIREFILAGGILYVIITVIQVIQRPSILIEGVVVGFALSFATAFYLTRKEHMIHASEVVALWAAVLLFAAYGMFKLGGAI
jgi:NADH:ubiquinone oxidoreductase subunit F (NADH-binding)